MRFETHSHTDYSNIRLLDSVNKVDSLIDRAVELGLAGVAITDHETVAGAVKANKKAQEVLKTNPDFKVALGNEIYLCDTRDKMQKYFHFILIAKDKQGFELLRILSSRAWMNSYSDRGMERVVTLKEDIEEIVGNCQGHLIATSACIGGELSQLTLNLIKAERENQPDVAKVFHKRIIDFMFWCLTYFGEDFYIECAPACSKEQIDVNQRLMSISNAFNVKMVIGSDAHYLKKEDRYVHAAYLNSKGGERETDLFYEYTYLQSDEEEVFNLSKSNFDRIFVEQMFLNSLEIYNKIENYSLYHSQQIPKVDVVDYPKKEYINPEYPIIEKMYRSDDIYDRYWINQCMDKLEEKHLVKKEYLDELEEEADVKYTIGEKLQTNMFRYPIVLQHYIDMMWEEGSTIGAGRGSACAALNHYLLGVTQLDSVKWNLPFFRYINREREEIGDIDIDLAPSKRNQILNRIKKERGENFVSWIDDLSRKNLGCTLVATFGTEGTRSAIQTACRGYRSEEFPNGIDVDTSQYLASLVPSERGFSWSLKDMVYGNDEKGRKASSTFIKEVEQYQGLLDIMFGIEGLIRSRGSHASGVILFDENPYQFGAFMKTPKGEIETQFDLHDAEYVGLTKYDFLVTDIQDKITQCIKFLQEDGQIDSKLSLREVYDKYLHPENIDLSIPDVWNNIINGNVLNCFQFDSDVGAQAAKKIQPHNIDELTAANGLMRLMVDSGERPMDKYIRFKENPMKWYEEMDSYGLTLAEQKVLEPYYLKDYGVPPDQENMMLMLMDPKICNFTLSEANAARKVVAKKQMNKINELKTKVLSQAKSINLGQYVWNCGVAYQLGYAFSRIHALAYSCIGYQSAYLSTKWDPIYWNTACLVVNSGALEGDNDSTTDYSKLAKAIGEIRKHGTKISLVNINESDFSFKPNIKNQEIRFGMKGVNKVGGDVIDKIIEGRPYTGIADFMNRCPQNKTVMVSLIKSGAFDDLDKEWASEISREPRYAIMAYYLMQVSEPKKKITISNMQGLIDRGFIPESLNFESQIYLINKFLKKHDYYITDDSLLDFFNENNVPLELYSSHVVYKDLWESYYQEMMIPVKGWIAENQKIILECYNKALFDEAWHKYASGNLSAWEMESLCFYYHEHELINIDKEYYGIEDFEDLQSYEIDRYFKRNGHEIPIYKTHNIVGTVLTKNDTRSSVSLLTLNGVINVKFTKEYFAMFNRRISEVGNDGKKHITDDSWFKRGTKLFLTGYRRDDTFVTKSYKNTPTHQLYKIENVDKNGRLILKHDR